MTHRTVVQPGGADGFQPATSSRLGVSPSGAESAIASLLFPLHTLAGEVPTCDNTQFL